MRATETLSGPPVAARSLRVRGPRLARLGARVRGPGIDRRLAAGAAPWRSPTYAARAVQITTPRSRVSLARSLEHLIELAEQPRARYRSAAIEPCRVQVRDALPVILSVSSRLRSSEPVNARGVAQVRVLLSDGAGPCYTRTHLEALTLALKEASRWLHVDH